MPDRADADTDNVPDTGSATDMLPTSPEQLIAYLDGLGIETTTHSHPPVFTVEEAQALRGTLPGGHCKNLFLKDKKGRLWLVVALEDSAVDLKTLDKRIGSARLSFGNGDLLREVLGVRPGSVTPFAVINDTGHRVTVGYRGTRELLFELGNIFLANDHAHAAHDAGSTPRGMEDHHAGPHAAA